MTHRLAVMPGATWWELARLPQEGAVNNQDARLMAALSVLCRVENDMLAEEIPKGQDG